MSDIWPALAASLISAGAALSGVGISNRHSASRHRELLREEALTAQRTLVVDVVLVGREWTDLQLRLVPMMSKFSQADLVEFVDTDSGVRLRELTKELSAALTRANLFLADTELRKMARALSDFVETFADAVNGPILKEPGEFDHVLAGIGAVSRFRNTLRRLEEAAIERLPSPVWHVAGD